MIVHTLNEETHNINWTLLDGDISTAVASINQEFLYTTCSRPATSRPVQYKTSCRHSIRSRCAQQSFLRLSHQFGELASHPVTFVEAFDVSRRGARACTHVRSNATNVSCPRRSPADFGRPVTCTGIHVLVAISDGASFLPDGGHVEATIEALQYAGKYFVCYISIGTWESWRTDWGLEDDDPTNDFPIEAIGDPLSDWEGEK